MNVVLSLSYDARPPFINGGNADTSRRPNLARRADVALTIVAIYSTRATSGKEKRALESRNSATL